MSRICNSAGCNSNIVLYDPYEQHNPYRQYDHHGTTDDGSYRVEGGRRRGRHGNVQQEQGIPTCGNPPQQVTYQSGWNNGVFTGSGGDCYCLEQAPNPYYCNPYGGIPMMDGSGQQMVCLNPDGTIGQIPGSGSGGQTVTQNKGEQNTTTKTDESKKVNGKNWREDFNTETKQDALYYVMKWIDSGSNSIDAIKTLAKNSFDDGDPIKELLLNNDFLNEIAGTNGVVNREEVKALANKIGLQYNDKTKKFYIVPLVPVAGS